MVTVHNYIILQSAACWIRTSSSYSWFCALDVASSLVARIIFSWHTASILWSTDPFADANKGADEGVQDGFVHIRIQQRNGRKTLTTVQGLSAEYDLKKIVRACKKVSKIIFIFNNYIGSNCVII
jgi:Translation initiation factor SUI1